MEAYVSWYNIFIMLIISKSCWQYVIPGKGCGTLTSVKILDESQISEILANKSPDTDFSYAECAIIRSTKDFNKLSTVLAFRESAVERQISKCASQPSQCQLLPPSINLGQSVKDQWTSFANAHYSNNANHGSHWTYDGYVTTYADGHGKSYIAHQSLAGTWMQISFEKAYYVTRVVMEARKNCCQHRLAHLEVRIGFVDTTGMDFGLLDVNEVCHSGFNTYGPNTTVDYFCPHPIKGLYLTLQKTQPTPNDGHYYAFTISEIFVHALKVKF